MFVNVNNTGMFVDIVGQNLGEQKPVLVCLHGSYLDHTYLKYSLAALGDRYQLVFPDFRGSGRSEDHSPEQWHARQMAEDILALLDILELEQVFLLAHSWGCHVAVQPVLSQSRRVLGNLFFNPGIVDFPCFYRNLARLMDERMAQIAEAIYEKKDLSEFAEFFERVFPHFFQVPVDEGLLREVISSEAFFINTIDEVRSTDLLSQIYQLPVDTVVCNGEHDLYLRDGLSAEMTAFLKAQSIGHIHIATFKQSGHFILHDENALALDLIDRFVAGKSARFESVQFV